MHNIITEDISRTVNLDKECNVPINSFYLSEETEDSDITKSLINSTNNEFEYLRTTVVPYYYNLVNTMQDYLSFVVNGNSASTKYFGNGYKNDSEILYVPDNIKLKIANDEIREIKIAEDLLERVAIEEISKSEMKSFMLANYPDTKVDIIDDLYEAYELMLVSINKNKSLYKTFGLFNNNDSNIIYSLYLLVEILVYEEKTNKYGTQLLNLLGNIILISYNKIDRYKEIGTIVPLVTEENKYDRKIFIIADEINKVDAINDFEVYDLLINLNNSTLNRLKTSTINNSLFKLKNEMNINIQRRQVIEDNIRVAEIKEKVKIFTVNELDIHKVSDEMIKIINNIKNPRIFNDILIMASCITKDKFPNHNVGIILELLEEFNICRGDFNDKNSNEKMIYVKTNFLVRYMFSLVS